MQQSGLEKLLTSITVQNIFNAVMVLLVAYIVATVLTGILSRLGEQMGLKRITFKMATPIIKIVIYSIAIYYILMTSLEVTPAQFLAVAGLLGAAIGFGLKDVFASFVGGLIIAVERPYNVGDMVDLKGNYGEVTGIGIRATKLITPLGNTVTVPNSFLIDQPVLSSNAGDIEMLVVIDIFIDPCSDFDIAMKVVKEAVITSKFVYIKKDRPIVVYLNDFPFYRRIRAKAFVYDLRQEFAFRSDVTVRTWRALSGHGIKPPQAGLVDVGGKKGEYG